MQKQSDGSSAEVLRVLAEGTSAAIGDEFFRSLARHAAQALGARYAFAAETLSELESRSLAYWEGSGFGEGFSYRFLGTPCQRVSQGHVCYTRSGLQQAFPEDPWLQQIGADSYVGVPMRNATGKVLGHVAVLHTEPLEPSQDAINVLQVFAARACAELERVQAERALKAAMQELERLRDRLQAENVYLQEELRSEHNVDEIVGSAPALSELLDKVTRVAASDAAVLIQGETGTGKELIARALHDRSPRRDRPLVKLNCGAISAGLVESELFGHVKGAFTGALSRHVGRFEIADHGTIFLDEVGELPAEAQIKLLRVLQEREFEPVGSNQTVSVDVRVLAASNRDLEEAVREGRFRADLFYRLNVIPLRVPPLRERRSDVAQLAMYFMQRSARKSGRPMQAIASETLRRLADYDWPGNVRELQNVIERAVVLSSGPVLEIDPAQLKPAPMAAAPSTQEAESAPSPGGTTLEEMERRHILSVLERVSWVIEGSNGAAELLNLHPSTLRSRMKKIGISR
ncbi:MAG: GAF domain-containing protein [Deltaproteobacteria bacterium]|nr:MAG: GAF domain-containing protein [Deltaproteobacteria bacterium]